MSRSRRVRLTFYNLWTLDTITFAYVCRADMPRRRPQIRAEQIAGNARLALDLGDPLSRDLIPHGDCGLAYMDLTGEPGNQPALRSEEHHPVHKQSINPDDATGEDHHAYSTDNINQGGVDSVQDRDVDLATRIRTGRRRAHFSQTALAQRLGVRQSAISQWESGRSQPDLDNRVRLADVLKIPLPELLPESGNATATALTDPTILSIAEQVAQLPPEWQVTIQLLVRHLVASFQKPR